MFTNLAVAVHERMNGVSPQNAPVRHLGISPGALASRKKEY
jgi:hypothetical protein